MTGQAMTAYVLDIDGETVIVVAASLDDATKGDSAELEVVVPPFGSGTRHRAAR